MGPRRARKPWVSWVAAAVAVASVASPPALDAVAVAEAEVAQPLRRQIAARSRPAVARSPWLDSGADQEQLGEPIDSGGGEAGGELPWWARSVETPHDGAAVRSHPNTRGSARRGRLGPDMRFPLLDRWHGPGCSRGPWYRVGAAAWVCGLDVALSREAPAVAPYPALERDAIAPFAYAYSGGGMRTYARPSGVGVEQPVEMLGAGWGLAILQRDSWRGRQVARTTRGTWIATRGLRWVSPSPFAGAHIARLVTGATLPIGWVRGRGARTYAEPGDRRHAGLLRGRAMVDALDDVQHRSRTFTRLADGRFVESRDLVRPVLLAPPDGVLPGERWVHVDLARQTLVAYEGEQPVFATLVSTGRRPGSTPRGLYRIRIKLGQDTMANLGAEDPEDSYSLDGVPWVQYFTGGIALHGAYWHDRFGSVKSHGCVNLAPRDARWLYAFTRPHVPDGWAVVLPTERDRGTPVYVH
ncbi:MAG: L,D-transpeptidase [Deltaproteobacteria bacterium]|nr:L,D-transpeptidase [Deltaproteobacteria bacterium]